MISGAYSNKYKAAQDQHIQRLKEQAKVEGQTIKERVKELSKETNRRRKALENKKKEIAEEEEKNRQAVLSERRKEQEEATKKFQRKRPNSGTQQKHESPQVLEDGIRVVRGHIVAIRNGQQVTVPTLEDALNMVNNPNNDNTVLYNGPQNLYQDNTMGFPGQQSSTIQIPGQANGTMLYPGEQDINSTMLYPGQRDVNSTTLDPGRQDVNSTTLYPGEKDINSTIWYPGQQDSRPTDTTDIGDCSNAYGHADSPLNAHNDGYGPDPFDEHLREGAILNGRPMFAVNQITDGALPQTIKKNSPSGSLTSLDSLDEVPSEQLPMHGKTIPGIIAKDKVKSAGKRRVTFSDSIEFDDGLTGQLVTAEKESCKQYVKQYNNRIAAATNNTVYNTSTSTNTVSSASSPSKPTITRQNPGKVIGTPGNTPIKSAQIPHRTPSPSSGSMVVPMSVYAQLQSNQPVASSGECTSSTVTHNDRPQQCVAKVQEEKDQEVEEPGITLDDSLDILHDSLDGDDQPMTENKISVDQEQCNHDKINDDDDDHDGSHQLDDSIEYYGNPSTIYKNPFGQRNTSKDTCETLTSHVSKQLKQGYAPELLLEAAVHDTADSHGGTTQCDMDIVSISNQPTSNVDSNTSHTPSSSYYTSWYPGSFFSSKTVFGDETDVDKKIVKKTNSVAYDLMGDTITRQRSVKSTSSKNTGRTNPLGAKPSVTEDINQDITQITSQVKTTRQEHTARPPPPSTRSKAAAHSSPLHRKRAIASAKRTPSKTTPKSAATRRSPVINTKEKTDKNKNHLNKGKAQVNKTNNNKNNKQTINKNSSKEPKTSSYQNQSNQGRVHSTTDKKYPSQEAIPPPHDKEVSATTRDYYRGNSSSSDEEELLRNIERNMQQISMLNSPAQDLHQKMLNSLADSPVPSDTKSNFKSVYKKVHKPRLGSAKQGPQIVSSNMAQGSKIPVYLGPSGNANQTNRRASSSVNQPGAQDQYVGSSGNTYVNHNGRNSSAVNQHRYSVSDQSNRPGTHDKDVLYPHTAAIRQSIPLDKTPTDDEINILWDRVRNVLHHTDAPSVGSDSCVNRIDVRRSRTQDNYYTKHNHSINPLSRTSRAASVTGLGTMQHYGSHEALRRYGSADNIAPYRQQPLLQHRALKTRQSGQGKPLMGNRQSFSPKTSRQAPNVTMSTRGGPAPLSQTELRAVMEASQQELNHHPAMARTAPSALSIEENKLLQSLDRLNERLRVQETITNNMNRQHEQPTSSAISHRTNHQRTTSATYKRR